MGMMQILSDFHKYENEEYICQSVSCLVDAISTLITTGLRKNDGVVENAFHGLKVFTRQLRYQNPQISCLPTIKISIAAIV